MNFGAALDALIGGDAITRGGWNGPGRYVLLQTPNAMSNMTLPYLFIHTAQGDLVPWTASQTDILATDWAVFHG